MIKVEVLNLGIAQTIVRFYLMMAVVIAAGFTGNWWLAILALPIFLSTILGVRFVNPNKPSKRTYLRAKKQQKAA